MAIKKLTDVGIRTLPDWSEVRELFLKLQEKTARAFKEYMDAMFAFKNSNFDPQLKGTMDQKNAIYQMAFNHFQSHFPNHTI